MLLKVNGKDIMTCSEDDLIELINNSDFRENETLEYKRHFSHLERINNQDREEKRAEYKCDICSFANADGGYLIYGIDEDNGCATSINGIDISDDDVDKFELNRRNELSGIQPKTPNIRFNFIKLETGKYVVVIHVKSDSFAPYVFIEKEKYYRIYRRSGNRKSVIGYSELKRMFNNSLSLEQSVQDYIFERVNYYRYKNEVCGERFIHICIIPETFKDSYYNHNMFLLEKEQNMKFGHIFNTINCNTLSIPCVDGIHFIPWSEDVDYADCYVKNSGVIEACISLKKCIHNSHMPWGYLWDRLDDVYSEGLRLCKSIGVEGKLFLCLSIIGCKGLISDSNESTYDYIGLVDRDEIYCDPIAVEISDDSEIVSNALKQLNLIFLLSIGVKRKKELTDLIRELQSES